MLGRPAHPRRTAEPWLSRPGQLHRQGPARQWPPAGTMSSCRIDDVAVVPAPLGSRHRGLRLPHRGHRVRGTAVGPVLHPAAEPARPPRPRHPTPPAPGPPAGPQPGSPRSRGGHHRPVPDPGPRQQVHPAFDDSWRAVGAEVDRTPIQAPTRRRRRALGRHRGPRAPGPSPDRRAPAACSRPPQLPPALQPPSSPPRPRPSASELVGVLPTGGPISRSAAILHCCDVLGGLIHEYERAA